MKRVRIGKVPKLDDMQLAGVKRHKIPVTAGFDIIEKLDNELTFRRAILVSQCKQAIPLSAVLLLFAENSYSTEMIIRKVLKLPAADTP